MHLAIINLRPATGKTTTAVQLAEALAETGRTLLVDSDPGLRALSWTEDHGALGFVALALPTRDIHRRLPEIARDFSHVVVDCPSGEMGIVASAILAVDHVVVPTPPTRDDLSALGETLDLVRQIGMLSRARASILLSQVTDRSDRARAERRLQRIDDAVLMDAEIPFLGSPGPADLATAANAFAAVADELLGDEASGRPGRTCGAAGGRFSRSR